MKHIFLLVICFSSFAAAADPFSGTWTGTGSADSAERNQAVVAKTTLTITLAAKFLSMKECWTVPDLANPQCIESLYDIQGDMEIYSRGKKIGDVYPGQILVMQSNDQVAEQIRIDLTEDGSKLRYEYNYMNMNGDWQSRKVLLTHPAPAAPKP